MKVPIGAMALVLALAVAAGLRLAGTGSATARFAFDPATFAETPEDVVAALGGPLTGSDAEDIQRQARAELERAFAGLRIRFAAEVQPPGLLPSATAGPGPTAFWRILVVPTVVRQGLGGRAIQNAAGASYALGPLGGGGFLNFTTLALKAVVYAPPDVSRDEIVTAIGRGIGRSAVHELTHLILGARPAHSDDAGSYEYHSADRASQYYGELRWASARPQLEERLGRSR